MADSNKLGLILALALGGGAVYYFVNKSKKEKNAERADISAEDLDPATTKGEVVKLATCQNGTSAMGDSSGFDSPLGKVLPIVGEALARLFVVGAPANLELARRDAEAAAATAEPPKPPTSCLRPKLYSVISPPCQLIRNITSIVPQIWKSPEQVNGNESHDKFKILPGDTVGIDGVVSSNGVIYYRLARSKEFVASYSFIPVKRSVSPTQKIGSEDFIDLGRITRDESKRIEVKSVNILKDRAKTSNIFVVPSEGAPRLPNPYPEGEPFLLNRYVTGAPYFARNHGLSCTWAELMVRNQSHGQYSIYVRKDQTDPHEWTELGSI
jgi:hypothetical protein